MIRVIVGREHVEMDVEGVVHAKDEEGVLFDDAQFV